MFVPASLFNLFIDFYLLNRDQGTVDFPLRVVELNLLALASDFVDYSDP